jgi:hypothetical protein
MTFVDHGDSKGWIIGDHEFHSTEKFPMSDNGTCFAAINDDKYDSEDGSAHVAENEEMITPWIDLSNATVPLLGFEYMTFQGLTFSVHVTQDEVNWDAIYFAPTWSLGGMVDWMPVDIILFGNLNPKIKDPSKPVKFKFQFDDRGLAKFYGAAVDNIIIRESAKKDLALVDHFMAGYALPGDQKIRLQVHHLGSDFINSATIGYRIDDGPIQRQTVHDFGLRGSFNLGFTGREFTALMELGTPVNIEKLGRHTLTFFIESIDNAPSLVTSNDTLSFELQVVPELPEKKVISYTFSHVTCRPCYDVHQTYKELLPDHPEIIHVGTSTSDPLATPLGIALDERYCGFSHPGSIADLNLHRLYYRFRYTRGDFVNELQLSKHSSPMSVEFKKVDIGADFITVDLEARFYAEVEGDFRFNLYLLEDSIKHYQAGAPEGHNYQHMNILRHVAGNLDGVPGSIPSVNQMGDVVTHSFTIPIEDHWKMKDLHFVGLVQNNTGKPISHHVINAERSRLTEWLSSSSTDWELLDLKVFPNPTRHIINIALTDPMSDVSYSVFDQTGRLETQGFVHNLTDALQIEIADWAPGVYIIQLRSDREVGSASFIKK